MGKCVQLLTLSLFPRGLAEAERVWEPIESTREWLGQVGQDVRRGAVYNLSESARKWFGQGGRRAAVRILRESAVQWAGKCLGDQNA